MEGCGPRHGEGQQMSAHIRNICYRPMHAYRPRNSEPLKFVFSLWMRASVARRSALLQTLFGQFMGDEVGQVCGPLSTPGQVARSIHSRERGSVAILAKAACRSDSRVNEK